MKIAWAMSMPATVMMALLIGLGLASCGSGPGEIRHVTEDPIVYAVRWRSGLAASRLVIGASGWSFVGIPDAIRVHDRGDLIRRGSLLVLAAAPDREWWIDPERSVLCLATDERSDVVADLVRIPDPR